MTAKVSVLLFELGGGLGGNRQKTYVNSVVFVAAHLGSTALETALGTGYSLMKFP